MRDRRVLGLMEAQLTVAVEATIALRSRLADHRIQYGPLIAEATALRNDVADRLDVGGDLDDLRQRFSDLSRAILALYVSAAEA